MGLIALVMQRLRSEEGATAIEYALMVALIAVVIILAVTFLGIATSDKFQQARRRRRLNLIRRFQRFGRLAARALDGTPALPSFSSSKTNAASSSSMTSNFRPPGPNETLRARLDADVVRAAGSPRADREERRPRCEQESPVRYRDDRRSDRGPARGDVGSTQDLLTGLEGEERSDLVTSDAMTGSAVRCAPPHRNIGPEGSGLNPTDGRGRRRRLPGEPRGAGCTGTS